MARPVVLTGEKGGFQGMHTFMDDSLNVDHQIKARLAGDDISAIDLIWDHYAGDLLGYLISILCSRQDAEDVLQAVFIKIARNRQMIAQAQSLKSYLFRMGRNEALNTIRQRKRRDVWELENDWLVAGAAGVGDEDRHRLLAALSMLPEDQRLAVMLKIYQDKTFREIAELLEIPENTAASRYRYGIEKLRSQLRRDNDEIACQ
jgi:RNA polymerase sigma-70 factor (ECF subfamily)